MEELSIKIAELLDITVESAIKLYPVLRSQFIVYKTTSLIELLSTTAIAFIVIYILASMIIKFFINDGRKHDLEMAAIGSSSEENTKIDNLLNNLRRENQDTMKKELKKIVYISIPLIVYIISKIIKFSLATDLILLIEFL